MQDLIVALIVAACAAYAVWALMPVAARRALALKALAWRWPGPVARWLQRASQGGSCCSGGCDGKPSAKGGGQQVIQIHRKRQGRR